MKQELRDLVIQMHGQTLESVVMLRGVRGVWIEEDDWDRLVALVKELTKSKE